MAYQRTLAGSVQLDGIGLHSGEEVGVRLDPAAAGAGIRLRRALGGRVVEIPALSRHVVDTTLATVLGRDGVTVSTVEHCLAALAGLGVDNATVTVDGPELPALDGSARPYVEAVQRVGLRLQGRRRRVLRILEPVWVETAESFALLRPGPGLRVSYSVAFDGRLPEDQTAFVEVTPETFGDELSGARTFGFLEDVERLRALGKARGGSLDNALVIDGGRLLNPGGLRMEAEFARHKILDAVGDLSLAGIPVIGHLVAHRGGHALHDRLVKAVLARPQAWVVEDADAALDWCPWAPPEQAGQASALG